MYTHLLLISTVQISRAYCSFFYYNIFIVSEQVFLRFFMNLSRHARMCNSSHHPIEVREFLLRLLKSVILYGSYARGDYTPDSDIDIMILVDLSVEEMDAYSDALSELGFKYNVQHDIWMMPVVKNQQHFYHWAASYPFYSNVQKEGVVLYEAA